MSERLKRPSGVEFTIAGLITPTLRQRLIRTYNPQGTWVSLTLVTEQKQ